MKILNTKQIKEVKKKVLEQWGCELKTDYAFLLTPKNKLYVVSRDIANIDYEKLKLQVVGNYFGEIMKNGELRLSIEGSQLVGREAKKNVVEISEKQVRSWLFGQDLPVDLEEDGFVIVKNNSDFMGSGKVKDGCLLNFIPKIRRISSEQ